MTDQETGQVPDRATENFKLGLVQKAAAYAEENYVVYSRGVTAEAAKRQQERAAELLSELTAYCAQTLLEIDDVDTTMELIRTTVVNYRYGNGYALFEGSSASAFYRELAAMIAKNAREKDRKI